MLKTLVHYFDLAIIVLQIITACCLLAKSKSKNDPILFLGAFIFSLSVTFIFIVLYYTRLFYDHLWTLQIENGLVLAHAPFYFLFISALLDPYFTFDRKKLWHFLPALLSVLITIPFYLYSYDQRVEYLDNIYSEEYPLRYVVIALASFVQYVVYYYIGFKKLIGFSHRLTQLKQDTEEVRMWINSLVIIFYTSTVISFFPALVKYDVTTAGFIPLLSSPYFFFILYTLLTKPEMFSRIRQSSLQLEAFEVPEFDKKIEMLAEKYSELSDRLHREVIKRSLYRDPEISLSKLADLLDTKPYVITWIIKNHYNDTFYNYINSLRIEEAKKILGDKAYKNYTIDYIGQLVGFNSKSVFYTAFKKAVGETPTQYTRRINGNASPAFNELD
jgi:AraC-like DNA-binding protein